MVARRLLEAAVAGVITDPLASKLKTEDRFVTRDAIMAGVSITQNGYMIWNGTNLLRHRRLFVLRL